MSLPNQVSISEAHALYCRMTGQPLSMRYDRERLWFDILKEYSLADVRQVILYLQRQIRENKRNVGALKLSNFLQPDKFEEDLAISRVKLKPVLTAMVANGESEPKSPATVSQSALEHLREFKRNL